MPTGTGKTHVLAAIVSEACALPTGNRSKKVAGEHGCTVLVVAHRIELISQISDTLSRFGIAHGIMNKGFTANKTSADDVRIASIQTLSKRPDSISIEPELVIIDEAHHALAKTYRMLWDRWPEARFLGLTATPCRMNHAGFTDLFDTLVTSWSISEFIEKGRLSLFDYISIRPNSEEQRLINSLKKRGADGDYQIKEMNELLNRNASIRHLYRSIEKFAKGKKGIVYAISIDHARHIADYYSDHGIMAVAIDSKTPSAERKRLVNDFKDGRIDVLVNVDIFSEGFDCPDVEFVQLARPTLSLSKYLQQVGRGLRKTSNKDTCVLIDNVGLHRVFGLPTATWDWDSMFRGEATGRGSHVSSQRATTCPAATPAEASTGQDEMEVVVSHERLLSALSEQEERPSGLSKNVSELKAYHDESSGLWGLRRGKARTTKPMFAEIFDTGHDMAAVKFANNRCGLVNAHGETILEKGHYQSMKFSKNDFLTVITAGGNEHYIDLYSMRTYEKKPEIKRYGDIELLKTGHICYSRTKVVYSNDRNISSDYIRKHKFYITIFDYNAAVPYCIKAPYVHDCKYGFACLLEGDHDNFYWMRHRLADGSIIITDGEGRYYHAASGNKKEYIGCRATTQEENECNEKIGQIAIRAEKTRQQFEHEKAAQRQRLLDKQDEATPFRSGMKWGLKVGGHVTVPPIYRNIKSPVGRYCAVEKNYSQWGVISLDGTLVIEPKYSDIEINAHGTATGTKVTGNKEHVKLP